MSTRQTEASGGTVVLEGFSSPYQAFDDIVFEGLVQETTLAVLQLFVDQFREDLTSSVVGFEPTLLEIIDGLTFEEIWTPVIGQCLQALRNNSRTEARRAVLGLLLHLSCRGVPGSWSIGLDGPGIFLWDSFLLPASDTFSIKSDGKTTASMRLKDSSLYFWRNENDRWESNDAVAAQTIQTPSGRVILLSHLNGLDPDCFRLDLPLVDGISPTQLTAISESFDILKHGAPGYHSWVCRILRYLGIIKSPENFMRSGSLEWFWGLVAVSNNPNPLSICEMLVHECSHQYFNFISRLGSPSNNPNLYYSPFPKALRPMDKIMLGYHAFGNVFLFYRECLSNRTLSAECEQRMRIVRDDIQLVQDLTTDPQNWTPIGQALIQPLAERIRNEE